MIPTVSGVFIFQNSYSMIIRSWTEKWRPVRVMTLNEWLTMAERDGGRRRWRLRRHRRDRGESQMMLWISLSVSSLLQSLRCRLNGECVGVFFLCRLNLLLPIFCSAAFITLLLSHSLCYLYVSLPTLYVHSFFPSSLFFSSHVSYASDAPTHCCSSEVEVQASGCQPKHLLRDSMNSPGRPSRQSKRSPKKGLPATTDEPALSWEICRKRKKEKAFFSHPLFPLTPQQSLPTGRDYCGRGCLRTTPETRAWMQTDCFQLWEFQSQQFIHMTY